MRRLAVLPLAGLALVALTSCDPTGPGDDDDDFDQILFVTARSATTLSLEWESLGGSNSYSVDFLTGVARCDDFPQHNDGIHVTGTSVRLTNLTPATRYHIHIHLLPHPVGGAGGQGTNIVFVSTLAAGAPEQAVTASDYEACGSGIGE